MSLKLEVPWLGAWLGREKRAGHSPVPLWQLVHWLAGKGLKI